MINASFIKISFQNGKRSPTIPTSAKRRQFTHCYRQFTHRRAQRGHFQSLLSQPLPIRQFYRPPPHRLWPLLCYWIWCHDAPLRSDIRQHPGRFYVVKPRKRDKEIRFLLYRRWSPQFLLERWPGVFHVHIC